MRSHATLVLLLVLAACSSTTPEPLALAAGGYSLRVSRDGRDITLTRGGDTLLAFGLDSFQLGLVDALDDSASYDPYWLENDDPLNARPPEDLRWVAAGSATVKTTSPQSAEVRLAAGDASLLLTLRVEAEGRFSARLTPSATTGQVAYIRLRPRASATEAFYGLGEWGDSVNHRGKRRAMQLEAALAYENGSDENHVPVPLLIGTRGWGLFVESRRHGLFDVAGKEPDLVEITYGTAEQSSEGLAFHLFAAAHPLDITRRYYDVTGDPLLPAPWALGPWIWRDEHRDQAQVMDDIAKIRSLDLATSGIWIDRPYASAVNTFDFNPKRYPDPRAMIDTAHANGLRVALWHTPYLENPNPAKNPDEAAAMAPLRERALSKGYFPPRSGLLVNHWSVPIDFTSPDAYAWWQSQVRRYTDLGIEGFKLDFAEDVLAGAYGSRGPWLFADGSDERTMAYGYTLLYHKVYAETLPASGGFLLCRAGRWGDQKHVSVIWPGDLDASFARKGDRRDDGRLHTGGLPASVADGLSLGPSGFPFFAADTGGYNHSPPKKEVFIRWFQQTALSTVMEVGDSSSQTPWEFNAQNGRDQATLDLYREYARLHLRLFPYIWTYAQNLKKDGRPIARALGLAYPELGVHPSDTYLFGDHLLVAPVVEEGKTSRTVHLPPGDWFDWFDGTRRAGGTAGAAAELPAPLEKLPLLLRAGGIVPLLRPTIDTLAPVRDPAEIDSFATAAGRLHLRMAPGTGTFTVYDGTLVQQAPAGTGLDVALRPGAIFTAGMTLEILQAPPAASVDVDGTALAGRADAAALEAAADGWLRDAAGTLHVKLGPGPHTVAIR